MTQIANEKIGVMLINLGTPDDPSPKSVRRYLKEFLADPRVIDINALGRWLLLYLFILPFRPKKSAEAYSKIWSKNGSPLYFHSQKLCEEVQKKVGDQFKVVLGMRYANPSLSSALGKLIQADVGRIIAVPLFPQYASASSGSAAEKLMLEASKLWNVPDIRITGDFFDNPYFIRAFADVSKPQLDQFNPDHILLSYHGLPERHMIKSDKNKNWCLKSTHCCDTMNNNNRYCYKAQCYATSRALQKEMNWTSEQYSVSFQSRLGRTPWIQPYTDGVIPELARKGVKRLAVMCPAFVADCLETLEEIGMRAKEQWLECGGEDLVLITSLNSEPAWCDAVARMVQEIK